MTFDRSSSANVLIFATNYDFLLASSAEIMKLITSQWLGKGYTITSTTTATSKWP